MNMNAHRAAEMLETAFCSGAEFPNVSHVLGSDWAAGWNFSSADAYREAAYAAADAKFGELPWHYSPDA